MIIMTRMMNILLIWIEGWDAGYLMAGRRGKISRFLCVFYFFKWMTKTQCLKMNGGDAFIVPFEVGSSRL